MESSNPIDKLPAEWKDAIMAIIDQKVQEQVESKVQ